MSRMRASAASRNALGCFRLLMCHHLIRSACGSGAGSVRIDFGPNGSSSYPASMHRLLATFTAAASIRQAASTWFASSSLPWRSLLGLCFVSDSSQLRLVLFLVGFALLPGLMPQRFDTLGVVDQFILYLAPL